MDSQIIALWFYSFLPAPPQDHEPSISSTISLPICEPIFISPTSYRNSPMGPPPFISFQTILPSLGHSFHTGAPVSVFVHFSPKLLFIIYCTNTFISSHYIFVVTVGDLAFFFGHTQPMSPLVGALLIIYPCRHRPYLQSTPQVTYLYPLNLFTLSRLWHNLSRSCRPPDTRPCYTVAATVSLIHPPTKGSLESSHFLTSSMYLCHFLTSVDSTEPFLLLGVASPFCRHQHTFPEGRQYLDSHSLF
jgi:hypothetical protein